MRVTEKLREGHRRPQPGETYPVEGLEGGRELGDVVSTERHGGAIYVTVDVDPELTEKANMRAVVDPDLGTTQDLATPGDVVRLMVDGEDLLVGWTVAAIDPGPRGGIKFTFTDGTPPSEPEISVDTTRAEAV